MTRILASPIAGALSAMILVAALVAATTNHFLDQGNLSNLALQVSIVAIVAIGSTIVRTSSPAGSSSACRSHVR